MQKSILERFISKYNLNGAAESVLWTTDGTSLSTGFISDDKNVLGFISTSELGFEEGEYAIYNTTVLRGMIGVLDEDIEIGVNKVKGSAKSLGLHDTAAAKVTFVLADPSILNNVPDVKAMPDFLIEIALDSKFMNTFVKGKNALPDVETFTVLTENGKTQIILGYSASQNTNRVAFNVELIKGEGLDEQASFSARYLKDILLANKEARGGTLKVSNKGLSYVSFNVDGFKVEYYLIGIKLA